MSSTSTTHSNKIFCLIGPSGTGKDAVAHEIPLKQIVSYRTRNMRTGEVDGVNGHFISKEEFIKKMEEDLWIADTIYDGHYYGVTQGELMDLEDAPMLYVIDYEGVEKLQKGLTKIDGYGPEQIVTIFLHTPRQDLERRMLLRGNSRDEIRARLDRSDRDYATSGRCDYVVNNFNGELDAAVNGVMRIILLESFKGSELPL